MTRCHLSSPGTETRYGRRRFLLGAAGVTAMLPFAARAGEQAPTSQRWTMKLSTSSLHYRSLPLTQAVRRISALGFEGIDVWSHFEWAGPLCEHLEEGLLKMGPERFSELLSRHKLKLFSASCYSAPLKRFAAALGRMGGCVVIRGSRPAAAGSDSKVAPGQLKEQMRQFLESLKPDLELAEKHNCTIAIENHSGKSLLNRLDSIQAFVDLNTHDRLGIALAPYHIQFNKESVEKAIRIAGAQLKFFYAWQHAEGTQQLPGIGDSDMAPWLSSLARIGYSGYVNPFMHHEPEPDAMGAALAKSRAYLLRNAPGS